jgi:anaerobic ribonucleoside-triphosphate reductase
MKILKKGTRLSLPIHYDLKYKVNSGKAFEVPEEKQRFDFKGDVIQIVTENNKELKVTPDHRCEKWTAGEPIEVRAEDLRVGDIVDTKEGLSKISTINLVPYEGAVYCFTMPSDHLMLNEVVTRNCCRLLLDLRELRKKNGGLFGAAESTGSIGVVTINLPRIGYLSHSKDEFFQRLDSVMRLAKDSLELKRSVLTRLLEEGLYPYTKRYLPAGFANHFSTIGVIGMNEMCRNFFRNTKKKDWGIAKDEGEKFCVEVLNFMREKCSDYQEETENLYNLEAVPGESTCYRFALHDKKKYPDIITAGTAGTPYYTNSTHLPVGYTDDPWDAIKIQERLQTLLTGGCVTLDTTVEIDDTKFTGGNLGELENRLRQDHSKGPKRKSGEV